MYDVTEPVSFEDVDRFWVPEVESYADKGVDVLLVGNKSDCDRVVETDRAKEYAKEKGYDFEEVSAKTADRVSEAIKAFGKKAADRKTNKRGSMSA